jgi:hypothetical protein
MERLDRRSRTIYLNESIRVESSNDSMIDDFDRLNKSVIDYARSQSPPNKRFRDASPSQCHICGKSRNTSCKSCGLNVCKAHLITDAQKRKVCDSCYRKQIIESKGAAFASEEQKIEQVQFHIIQQAREREQRLDINRDVDTAIARLTEAIRKHAAEVHDERRKQEQRLERERDRNAKVQSQVTNLKLAYEDAKKSENYSSLRKAEAEAQVKLLTSELKGLKAQEDEICTKLGALTVEVKSAVHCRQFLLMGCRDCKRRFTAKFRNELMKSNLSFDNFSFLSADNSVPLPRDSVVETEKESCKCELM